MVKISKVEVQAKNKSRVNVYVDGEFYTGLDLDTCVKYGLKANYEIEQERLADIVKESESQSALSKSVKYMSRALKTTKQIKDYLKGKGYDSQTIEYCIAKLNEYNYLDDAGYVRAYIKDNYKRIGINKIRFTLESKGISKNIIDDELENYEVDLDELYKLALKKLGTKPKTYDNLAKTMVFLSNRGFEHDDIKKVINRLKENEDESWC